MTKSSRPRERAIVIHTDEEVRTLLDGTKTQHRVPIVPGRSQREWLRPETIDAVKRWAPSMDSTKPGVPAEMTGWWTMAVGEPSRIIHCGHEMDGGHIGSILCPFGVAGDRLWVRETWAVDYRRDAESAARLVPTVAVSYAASCGPGVATNGRLGRWRQSTRMPRWASRMTLEILSVRIERLQAITEEDAKAEGVEPVMPIGCNSTEHRTAFRAQWDRIHHQRAPWSANPWVWTLTFRRIS